MRTFPSLEDFSQSAVFDLSFQFLILHLLTEVLLLRPLYAFNGVDRANSLVGTTFLSFKSECLSNVRALCSASGSSNANRSVSLASFQKLSALSITPPKTCKCIILNMIITDTNIESS